MPNYREVAQNGVLFLVDVVNRITTKIPTNPYRGHFNVAERIAKMITTKSVKRIASLIISSYYWGINSGHIVSTFFASLPIKSEELTNMRTFKIVDSAMIYVHSVKLFL